MLRPSTVAPPRLVPRFADLLTCWNPGNRLKARQERLRAWSATKLAVRAYANDPSKTNADNVKTAFLRIRRLTPMTASPMRSRLKQPH